MSDNDIFQGVQTPEDTMQLLLLFQNIPSINNSGATGLYIGMAYGMATYF